MSQIVPTIRNLSPGVRGVVRDAPLRQWLVWVLLVVGSSMIAGSCARTPQRAAASVTDATLIGTVTITDGPATLPIPFITNESVSGLSEAAFDAPLAAPAGGVLMGWNSPVGLPSPDGRYIAYNSWKQLVPYDPQHSASSQGIDQGAAFGIPSLRILDLATGEDTLLEEGAFSIAWNATGEIAYFKATKPEYRWMTPYLGQVVVRDSLDAPAVVWIEEPGEFTVHSWAGAHLLVYGDTGLVVVDGPGKVRKLSDGAAVIALSPDGTRVLVARGPGLPIELIDVESGKAVAELDVSTAFQSPAGTRIVTLNHAGSWQGEWVAAQGTLEPDGSAIVILRVASDSISVSRVLEFPSAEFPMGISEPQLLGPGGSRVVAWAPVVGQGGEAKGVLYSYLDCDVSQGTCAQGPPLGSLFLHPLYNPSQPGGGGVGPDGQP